MAITFIGQATGTAANQNVDTSTTVAVLANDVVIAVTAVNQTTAADTFTSHTATAGSTATLGTVTEFTAATFNAETLLAASWARVSGSGDLAIRSTINATRTQAVLFIVLRGVDTGVSPLGTPASAVGLAGQPASGTVTPSAAGDWFVGFGAYEEVDTPGLGAPTPTATPSAWTARSNISSGNGVNSIRGYIETFQATDTTAYQSAPTLSTATDWAEGVVAVAAAAGGGGGSSIAAISAGYHIRGVNR